MRALKNLDLGIWTSMRRTFIKAEQVLQLGRAPHRIDLLTSISGVSIERLSPLRSPRSSMSYRFPF